MSHKSFPMAFFSLIGLISLCFYITLQAVFSRSIQIHSCMKISLMLLGFLGDNQKYSLVSVVTNTLFKSGMTLTNELNYWWGSPKFLAPAFGLRKPKNENTWQIILGYTSWISFSFFLFFFNFMNFWSQIFSLLCEPLTVGLRWK